MDERETVIAALCQIIIPFFLRITHDIVVSWQRPVWQFSENGQIGLIDGILDRIAGIVYKVACIHDEIRLAGKRLVESRLHQRIAMLISEIARKTFDRILARRSNPKGIWTKAVPGTRPMKDFALPMIICNMALEVEPIIDDKALLDKTIEEALHEVFDVFYQPDLGVMVENLAPDGSLIDCFEGRKVNPGHDLEALWFMMNLGLRLNKPEIIRKSVDISLRVIDYGWDKQYGGIFYFMDRLGHPTQELEWDQKLWWVHLEAAICMIKGYQLTGNGKCLEWFLKLHDYLWKNFKDSEYPEWFGYLNRRGEVLLPLKGGKWKGCFHVPRGLYQIGTILQDIADRMK